MVVLDGRNLHLAAHVGGGAHVLAEQRGLHGGPLRVVEVHGLPVVGRLRAVVLQLPVVVLDLEGQQRGEHGGHGGHLVRDLARLEDHRAHIHRQVVAGGVVPAVAVRIDELDGVDLVRQTEVSVVQRVGASEARHGSQDLAGGSLAGIQLVRALGGVCVSAGHERDQRLAARADGHGEGDDGGGGASAHLGGGDGVGLRSRLGASRAAEGTGLGIELDAGGQRGLHGEVTVVVGVGVHLAHLDVLVQADRGGGEGQIGHRGGNGVGQEVDVAQLPLAGLRVARAEVLEAVLVPGLVVLQPHLLVLAQQRPGKAGHVLQRRPVIQVGVTGLHVELHGLLAVLGVVEHEVHGGDPLAAVIGEGDHHGVVRALLGVDGVAVVLAAERGDPVPS